VKQNIDWSMVSLGQKPDSQIARELNTSRRRICYVRKKLRIPAFTGFILTQEGSPCRSVYEGMYDAYLHWQNIKHGHEISVKNLPYIADFKIKNTYVEIFGMTSFKKYNKKIEKKKKDYMRHKINFKEIKIKEIEELYKNCPIKVNFRERFCIDCKKLITRSYYGRCHSCYMCNYHKRPIYKSICKKCGKIILSDRKAKYCSHKCYWEDSNKIKWPSKKRLEKMFTKYSWRKVAKKLGVTLAVVQRKSDKLGIKRPGRKKRLLSPIKINQF